MAVPPIGDRWPLTQTVQYTFRVAEPAADHAGIEALVIGELDEGLRRQAVAVIEKMHDPAMEAAGGEALVLLRHPPGGADRIVGAFYRASTTRRCRVLHAYLSEDAPRNVRLGTACVVILFEDYLARTGRTGELAVDGPAGRGIELFRSLGFSPEGSRGPVERWVAHLPAWDGARAAGRTRPWFT